MNVITAKMLEEKGACGDQVKLFRKMFGESAVVTVEGCIAVADKFDWYWAASELLTNDALLMYWDTIGKEPMVSSAKAFATAFLEMEES